MSKMLVKNTLRDIGRTKARFISIMLIILLGVGFLVGINSTAPSMYAVVDEYYAESNLMDFRVISTVGFTEEDVQAVKAIEGVDDVMPSYVCDVLTKGDTGSVIRLYGMPTAYGENDPINTLTLEEGRFPEKANEIVIGDSNFGDYTLGDTISFFSPIDGEDLSDSLANTEYEIVGIVNSPLYISFERGASNVGSGKVAAYMMIPAENFTIDRYTELYITFSALRAYEPYSEGYESLRESILDTLEHTADLREQAFAEEEIEPAQASLDEAQATFDSEKAKAEKELEDAQQKIDDARVTMEEEISSAENTLEDARLQIEAGRQELSQQKEEYSKAISAAEQELADAEEQLSRGETQIADAKAEMKESLFDSVSVLGITSEQFGELYGNRDMLSVEDVENLTLYAQLYKASAEGKLEAADDALKQLEDALTSAGVDPATNDEYISAKAQRDSLAETVDVLDIFLTSGKTELINAINTISAQEETLAQGKDELKKAKAELNAGKKQAEAQFSEAQEQLDLAWEEYLAGVKTLEESRAQAEAELEDAQKELDSKSLEAQEQFLKAENELLDAKNKLESIGEPKWYCYTRDNNPGYSTYVDNVERIGAVGKVFPVFFLLVAVLVCVTTMSRLVEEQRGDIGALTTLGYKKRDIILKYVAYAVSATLVGAGAGIAVGLVTIPYVLFNAYGMLYSSLPGLILTLDVGSAVISTLVAILCTATVAFVTCYSLLRKEPASLLRPKAPKPGKRIFLERVKFIWKRLSFFSKVTVRNIFRYKVRFLMTVVGVAGCTALIVAALGLYGSINDVVDKQFGEVFEYDAVVALESDADGVAVKEQILSDERMGEIALCRQTLATVQTSKIGFTDDTYICVPESIEDFSKIVNIKDRKSGDKIDFGTEGVILTEKLAKSLSVSVGDKVTVVDDNIKVVLPVEGICENYLYGYAYMSPQVYEKNFGAEAKYNLIMCTKTQGQTFDTEQIGTDYLNIEGVLGISFVSDSEESFNDMIGSLNYVVLVMLVCAGALAFVVLYNLTNINIAERKRELSTLKVLGFKNMENTAYIYRENVLMCVFGTLAGLVLGVWLLNFIIATVEIDMLMFGREIHFAVYLVAAVLTLLFAAIVNVIMHFRIKKIDMVESLKSVE